MESNHIARPDGARRVNLRVDVWDSSYLLARNELSTHGWRIPSQSVGWQSSPTRSLQNSNNALNLARSSARKELAGGLGRFPQLARPCDVMILEVVPTNITGSLL